MKDLSSDPQTGGRACLVPSSMNAGNTVADDPSLSMTAPGSPSVLPVPQATDRLPLPVYENAEGKPTPIPVNWPFREGEHGAPPQNGNGYHGWMMADGSPGPWTEV